MIICLFTQVTKGSFPEKQATDKIKKTPHAILALKKKPSVCDGILAGTKVADHFHKDVHKARVKPKIARFERAFFSPCGRTK